MINKREVVLNPFLPSMQKPIIKMYVFLKLATQHCSRNAIQWETLANPLSGLPLIYLSLFIDNQFK